MELRDYQHQCLDETRDALPEHQRVLLRAPTGAGKTVMAAWMTDAVTRIGNRVFFICHRRELVQQTMSTFHAFGLDPGAIANGWTEDLTKPVQVCSIQTLIRRLDRIEEPRLLIIDEGHHIAAKSFSSVLEHWPNALAVGLSATPCRLDGRGLDTWFKYLVPGPSVAELIADGFLSSYRLFAPSIPDLKGVRRVRGDYDRAALDGVMDNVDLVGDLVTHWKRHAAGRKTIAFAISRAHSRHIVDSFNEAGIAAIHLDGQTPTIERAAALRQFALGKYDVVSNVDLFGEGFDLAANAGVDCTVEAVICARPTQSLSIWLQQVGRALRPKPEPAIILDHAGNAIRHGLPDEEREWTLEGKKSKRDGDESLAPIRRCPQCFAVHPAAAYVCPECHHKYQRPSATQMEIRHGDGRLVEICDRPPKSEAKVRRSEQGRARTFTELYELGRERGHAKPAKWASHILQSRRAKRREKRAS